MEDFINEINGKRLLVTVEAGDITISTEATIDNVTGDYFFIGKDSFLLSIPKSSTITRDEDQWLVKIDEKHIIFVSQLDKIR